MKLLATGLKNPLEQAFSASNSACDPSAAEILIVSFDSMIVLPLHYQFSQTLRTKESFSNSLIRSVLKLRIALIDFRKYFKANYFFSVALSFNSGAFEADCQQASEYLSVRPSVLQLFLSGYMDLDEIIANIFFGHLDRVNITWRVLRGNYDIVDYLKDLDDLNITEDSYLTWISLLPRSIADTIFQAIYTSLIDT
jgi:hypothetical protein